MRKSTKSNAKRSNSVIKGVVPSFHSDNKSIPSSSSGYCNWCRRCIPGGTLMHREESYSTEVR